MLSHFQMPNKIFLQRNENKSRKRKRGGGGGGGGLYNCFILVVSKTCAVLSLNLTKVNNFSTDIRCVFHLNSIEPFVYLSYLVYDVINYYKVLNTRSTHYRGIRLMLTHWDRITVKLYIR